MEEGDREEPLLDDWHDGINAAEEESVEVPMIASRKRPRAKSSSEDESGGGGDGAFREDAPRPKRLVRPPEKLRARQEESEDEYEDELSDESAMDIDEPVQQIAIMAFRSLKRRRLEGKDLL